jgi:hypothetical protein
VRVKAPLFKRTFQNKENRESNFPNEGDQHFRFQLIAPSLSCDALLVRVSASLFFASKIKCKEILGEKQNT